MCGNGLREVGIERVEVLLMEVGASCLFGRKKGCLSCEACGRRTVIRNSLDRHDVKL